jgi:hypothetical protein
MSDRHFTHSLHETESHHEEVVVVIAKHYVAIADDLLRKLFPELTPDLLPRSGRFTVFIKDDDYVLH